MVMTKPTVMFLTIDKWYYTLKDEHDMSYIDHKMEELRQSVDEVIGRCDDLPSTYENFPAGSCPFYISKLRNSILETIEILDCLNDLIYESDES
jgi:hypothetical protein